MKPSSFSPSIRPFTVQHLWALVVLAGVFVFLNLNPIRPNDFWWHMAVGREILSSGQIPNVDTFSSTMEGQPYLSYQMFWLMDIALYLIYSLGGPALVVFFHALAITAAYALLLLLCLRLSGSWRLAALGTLFASALGLNDWNVRPQAITFLLGALFLFAIYSMKSGGKRRWLFVFPGSMLVWANSHGTFSLGFVLLGLWLADEGWYILKTRFTKRYWNDLDRLLLPAAAISSTALACLANPRGFGIFAYLSTMAASPEVQNLVPEWAPPAFNTLHGTLFLVGLLLSAAILAISPSRPTFFQLSTFIVFAALGLQTSRGIIWFGIFMAPTLSEHLSALFPNHSQAKGEALTVAPLAQKLNGLFAGTILLFLLLTLPWFKSGLPLPDLKTGLVSAETPIYATNFMLYEKLPGPVFHYMPYGSYLIWAAQPDYPVFVDSRIELYPYETWLDYILITNARGDWEGDLDRYGIKTLMLSKLDQAELVGAVKGSPIWDVVYEDDQTLIFTRK